MIKRACHGLFTGLLVTQCIGTDIVDDLASGSFTVTIQVPSRPSLLPGETLRLMAVRKTMSGEEVPTNVFEWSSSDTDVATVSPKGEVEALAPGQTRITAGVGSAISEPMLIAVVADENQIAQITLSAERMNLEVGEMLQIIPVAMNRQGVELPVDRYAWSSSDEAVLTVSPSGLVTAISLGSAQVTALADSVVSNPFTVAVGPVARTGSFQGSGSYDTQGSVRLELNDQGDVILSTSADFKADLALGTFLYLSNSTSGVNTSNDGIEIADISENPEGSKSFNVSEINEDVGLDAYRYVVILCKPARITFGFADLNE